MKGKKLSNCIHCLMVALIWTGQRLPEGTKSYRMQRESVLTFANLSVCSSLKLEASWDALPRLESHSFILWSINQPVSGTVTTYNAAVEQKTKVKWDTMTYQGNGGISSFFEWLKNCHEKKNLYFQRKSLNTSLREIK